MSDVRRFAALALLVVCAGCAANPAPPLPAVPAYPDFMYPAVPGAAGSGPSESIERGWRFLQNDNLQAADREFSAALGRAGFYPARTGIGYVALARKDFAAATEAFGSALKAAPAYLPALVGHGQALLELNRDQEALDAFEAALAVDATLAGVRQRVDVLRFRGLQDLIERARSAAAAGRPDEAVRAYEQAVAASPESAFLHRELGILERRQGHTDAALGHFRRAAELDPSDAAALIDVGELLEARQDLSGAEAAYRRAAALEPGSRASARLAAVLERASEARLPEPFRAIPASTQMTRGELAALIGVRLEGVLRTAPPREIVVTDAAGHWAASWIALVARAGIIEPFANHTFQPESGVTRGDLAGAVRQIVARLASDRPGLRPALTEQPAIADMTASHLSYPAAAAAVAAGVMPLLEGGRFSVGRPVSGAEAVEAVGRLRALAAGSR